MNPLLYILAAMAAAGIVAFLFWPKIASYFRDSETLFWARLQMAIGGIWEVLMMTNLGPVLDLSGLGKWAPIILFGQGIVTEVARRSRATDLK
jgi:hypothetical protein